MPRKLTPRKHHAPRFGRLALIAAALVAPIAVSVGAQTSTRSARGDRAPGRVEERHAKLPLRFEPNVGQTHGDVKFLSRAQGYVLFLTATEAVLASDAAAPLRMRWAGGNPHTAISGVKELPGKSNYYRGQDPRRWRTNVPHYAEVRFSSVYRGVDLVFYGTREGQVEYDFVVAPGADPAA